MKEITQVIDARSNARDALMNAMTLPSTHPLWDVYVEQLKVYAVMTDQTDKQAHSELCKAGHNA